MDFRKAIEGYCMIGFYNYTVVLTYIGLASAVFGMTQVFGGNYRAALLCLIVCGTCDMFDGKIARAKKDRTKQEKVFGIQIDSLCDLICFGMFPATLGYSLTAGKEGLMVLGTVAAVLFVLGAVIRLGYFNVMEEKRQEETDENRKYYQGLPITSMAMVLPLFFAFSPLLPSHQVFIAVLHILVAAVGALFVIDFKMRKLSAKELFTLAVIVAAAVAVMLFVWRSWWELLHFHG